MGGGFQHALPDRVAAKENQIDKLGKNASGRIFLLGCPDFSPRHTLPAPALFLFSFSKNYL
jgi:hypothetical protein